MSLTLEVQGAAESSRFMRSFGEALNPYLSRALNRTATMARTETRRAVTRETGLQAKYISPSLKLGRATPANLASGVQIQSRLIPLLAYWRSGFRSGRGIGGLPHSFGATPPRAFQAQMSSGHRGIYERRGRPRGPLRPLYGPTIPRVVEERGILARIAPVVAEIFIRRRQHEFNRLLESRNFSALEDVEVERV